MTTVIIDTNVLYAYLDTSDTSAIADTQLKNIFTSNRVLVTSASIIEWIVHHREDLATIKKLTNSLINQEIEIMSLGHIPISNEFIHKLNSVSTLDDASGEIEAILNLKISVEADFLRLFFLCLTIGYLYKLINDRKPGDEEKLRYLNAYTEGLIVSNASFFGQSINEQLKEAYSKQETDKSMKAYMNLMLCSVVHAWLLQYHSIMEGAPLFHYNDGDFSKDENKLNEIKIAVQADSLFRYTNSDNIYDHMKDNVKNDYFRNFIGLLQTEALEKEKVTDEFVSFFTNNLIRSFYTGGKIIKNDIIDMLISQSISFSNDTFVFTLDKNFRKHLKDVHEPSYKFIEGVVGSV